MFNKESKMHYTALSAEPGLCGYALPRTDFTVTFPKQKPRDCTVRLAGRRTYNTLIYAAIDDNIDSAEDLNAIFSRKDAFLSCRGFRLCAASHELSAGQGHHSGFRRRPAAAESLYLHADRHHSPSPPSRIKAKIRIKRERLWPFCTYKHRSPQSRTVFCTYSLSPLTQRKKSV